jgi:hypothetical protein
MEACLKAGLLCASGRFFHSVLGTRHRKRRPVVPYVEGEAALRATCSAKSTEKSVQNRFAQKVRP